MGQSATYDMPRKHGREAPAFQLVDDRTAAVTQQQMQEKARIRANSFAQLQSLADNYTNVRQQRAKNTQSNVHLHDGSGVLQGYNLTKVGTKGLANTMSDKRVDTDYWSQSHLTKNFAFDANDTDNYAHSQGNRHSEPHIVAMAGARNKLATLEIVTERAPCGDCHDDIEQFEAALGRTLTVKHFVAHDDNAPQNLYNLYSKWWTVPGRIYG